MTTMNRSVLSSVILGLAVLALGAPGVSTAATAAPAGGGTGTIVVHVTIEGRHVGKGTKVCATTKRLPTKGVIEGKCGNTNKKGDATLTRVPAGKRFVTLYDKKLPVQTAPKKAHVRAGHTVTFTFPEEVG